MYGWVGMSMRAIYIQSLEEYSHQDELNYLNKFG